MAEKLVIEYIHLFCSILSRPGSIDLIIHSHRNIRTRSFMRKYRRIAQSTHINHSSTQRL
ncbi:hypothetical protein ACRALDRAFT_1091897 [Sodiomyces alcalophilus JCM 7366]|uniref:uncharacterized protein n=1 Tax=Sodiomyces alcalophilus JCM 7366 TaxID=591952 RepID=UPI0039B5249D